MESTVSDLSTLGEEIIASNMAVLLLMDNMAYCLTLLDPVGEIGSANPS